MKKSRKFGFSLVELLIVVSIVAILSSLTLAGEIREPTVFRDRVSFRGSTGPDFDAANIFSIGGVAVTADAATLNSIASQVATSATTSATCSNLSATGTADITGAATLGATLNVAGATVITGAVTQVGAATLKSTLNVAGAVVITGAVTQVGVPVFARATSAAPTNTASQGFTITVNGTNYVLALYPN